MPRPPPMTIRNRPPWVSGVGALALALLVGLWAWSHFRAEARVRRATERIVRLMQKTAAEAPVALGLSGHRLGAHLAQEAVVEVEGSRVFLTGRPEVVQFHVQVRDACERIEFTEARISVSAAGPGEIRADVEARYRFVAVGGTEIAGRGQAELRWIRGEDGWRIGRARLTPDPRAALPEGWP